MNLVKIQSSQKIRQKLQTKRITYTNKKSCFPKVNQNKKKIFSFNNIIDARLIANEMVCEPPVINQVNSFPRSFFSKSQLYICNTESDTASSFTNILDSLIYNDKKTKENKPQANVLRYKNFLFGKQQHIKRKKYYINGKVF